MLRNLLNKTHRPFLASSHLLLQSSPSVNHQLLPLASQFSTCPVLNRGVGYRPKSIYKKVNVFNKWQDEVPGIEEEQYLTKGMMGYNKVVFPPREPGEPLRPAEVFHGRMDIRTHPDKLRYIAAVIRGMSVGE